MLRAARARVHRLPAWADSRLLPAVATALLITNVCVAANWLLSPATALTAPAYDVAKLVAPMPAHGVLMALTAVFAGGCALRLGRSWWTGYSLALAGGLWGAWTVLFALAPIGRPGASFLGAIFAGSLTALHLLAGLALSYQPLAATRR